MKNATKIGEKSIETHEKTSKNQPNDRSPKQTKTERVKKATKIGEKSTETHEKPMKISVKLVANGRAKDQEAEPSGCNHSLETFPPNDCNWTEMNFIWEIWVSEGPDATFQLAAAFWSCLHNQVAAAAFQPEGFLILRPFQFLLQLAFNSTETGPWKLLNSAFECFYLRPRFN